MVSCLYVKTNTPSTMNRFKIDTQEELGLGLERIIKEQLNDMMAQTMVPVSLDIV